MVARGRHGFRMLRGIAATALLLLATPALAEIARTVSVTSDPSDAEVFLLRGTREEPLGRTPLSYEATFHSEMSILRLAIKKSGYETRRVEISAAQPSLAVTLKPRGQVEAQRSTGNSQLDRLQARIVPQVTRVVSTGVETGMPYRLDDAREAQLRMLGGSIWLWVPLRIASGPEGLDELGPRNASTLSRALWSQLDTTMLGGLASVLDTEETIRGVLFDVRYDESDSASGVRVTETTEMVCEAGMRTEIRQVSEPVYDACATMTYDSYSGTNRCQGGMVSKLVTKRVDVYDPCARRVPKAQVRFAPDALPKGPMPDARWRFAVQSDLVKRPMSADERYEAVGVAVTNSRGRDFWTHNEIPGE